MNELHTVREINSACEDARNGRGRYVFADLPAPYGDRRRIVRAKTVRGVRLVYPLLPGRVKWVQAARVYWLTSKLG